jgi:hypothetical protein
MKKTLWAISIIIAFFSSTAALASEAVYSDKSIKSIYEKASIDKPVFVMEHLNSQAGGEKMIRTLNNYLSQEEIAKFELAREMKAPNIHTPKVNSSEMIYSDKSIKSVYEKTNINKPSFVMEHLDSPAGVTKFFDRILNDRLSPEEASKFELKKN